MGADIERLLGDVSGQLRILVPNVDANRRELAEVAQRVAQLEQKGEDGDKSDVRERDELSQRLEDGAQLMQDLVKQYGEIEKRLSDLERRPVGPAAATPHRGLFKGTLRAIWVEVAALAIVGIVGWLLTHFYTLSKVAQLLEKTGGHP